MASKRGLVDVDHVMCKVDDMDDAVSRFERMGFQFTPRSAIGGMSNRLAQLTPYASDAANFIELMTINDADKTPPLMRENLSGADGLKMIVHISDSIERALHTLEAVGAPAGDVWNVERDWVSPDGETEEVKFRVIIPKAGALPFLVNAYDPSNLSQYTQPHYQTHANGVRHLKRVLCAVEAAALQDAVSSLETLYGVSARAGDGDVFDLQMRDVAIRVVSAPQLALLYDGLDVSFYDGSSTLAGLTLEVADLDIVRRCISENGVPFTDEDQALWVGPEFACGMLIEFTAP